MKCFTLTPNQEQVMETLWRENRPLVRSEIIDLTIDRQWSKSSIHLLINELLEKEVIKVDGEVLMGINMARRYSPAITKDEFDLIQLQCHVYKLQPKTKTMIQLFENFLNEFEIDEKSLAQLQNLINTKKPST